MKISVVVPIYGAEKFLRQCVDSILKQTHSDLEVLLIDDGSKDNCPSIIDEYAAQNQRVVPIHKPNGGYSSAVNLGLDKATGDLISIIEPDDWIQPFGFEALTKCFGDPDVDIVKGDYNEMSDDGKLSRDSIYRRKLGSFPVESFTMRDNPVLWRFHPGICTCLYRREFLVQNNVRMKEAPGAAWTDNPFQIQTTYLARKIRWIDCPFYNYRATVSGPLRNVQVIFDRCNEIHDWLDARDVSDEMWQALYSREFEYLSKASHDVRWRNVLGCAKEIRTLCRRMRADIVAKGARENFIMKRAWLWYRYMPELKILYTKVKDGFSAN